MTLARYAKFQQAPFSSQAMRIPVAPVALTASNRTSQLLMLSGVIECKRLNHSTKDAAIREEGIA